MLQKDKILNLTKDNAAAEPVFGYIRNRERHRGPTDISRLVRVLNKSGINVKQSDTDALFNTFAELGLGHLEQISRNRRRFKWDINVVDLGKLLGNNSNIVVRQKLPIASKAGHITLKIGNVEVDVGSAKEAADIIKLVG